MRWAHGSYVKVMRDSDGGLSYHPSMMSQERRDTRTLTLVLPESEWRALREIEPDSVAWLQDRVRERLAHSAGRPQPAPISGQLADEDY